MTPPDGQPEAHFPGPDRPYYAVLVALVLPALNWLIALCVLALARNAAPLLVALPVLFAVESLTLDWRSRQRHADPRPRRLGTAGLLFVMTIFWSCVLTFIVFATQHNTFTF